MMAYWGFDNIYGRDTVDNDGNKIGVLVRFDTDKDRDDWYMNHGKTDGQPECLTTKQARSIMERFYRRTADPEDVRLGIYTMSEFVKQLSMDQLWCYYSSPDGWYQ